MDKQVPTELLWLSVRVMERTVRTHTEPEGGFDVVLVNVVTEESQEVPSGPQEVLQLKYIRI